MIFCKFAHKRKNIIMEGQTKLSAGQIGILLNALSKIWQCADGRLLVFS